MISRHRMMSIAALGLVAACVPSDKDDVSTEPDGNDIQPGAALSPRAEPSKRMPHQGKQECARRVRQMQKSKPGA